jgi:predicted HTH transcriptional regulator
MKQRTFDISKAVYFTKGNRLEAVAAQGGVPESVWKTYSSFANTEGGIILLGAEEKEDHRFVVEGVNDPRRLISEIHGHVSDRQRVSVNLLTERMVHAEKLDGKYIVVVEVPKAEPSLRPVYLNQNPEECTYRRSIDGDLRCGRKQLAAMYCEASGLTADQQILSNLGMSVFCKSTVKAYRDRFHAFRGSHIWNDCDDERFLRNIGAAVLSPEDRKYHPTLAGLIMFGCEPEIVKILPQYSLEYHEEFAPQARRTYRLASSSGDWSGNIFDFFRQVCSRLCQGLSVPLAFKDRVARADESHSHRALRELLLNALAHGDYRGEQGSVIINSPNGITIANPGDLRVDLKTALKGGVSDPRNPLIMRMFTLAGFGDRAGYGMSDAVATMREEVNADVSYGVDLNPARTTLKIHFSHVLPFHPEHSGAVEKSAVNRR